MVVVLELAGAVSILAAFTLGQLRLLDQHSLVYLLLNLVGSAVLAVIALAANAGASCSWRASGRSSRRRASSASSSAAGRAGAVRHRERPPT